MKNNNVVVTGAGSGIGREIAKTLHKNGFNVALIGRNPHSLVATLYEIGPEVTSFEDAKTRSYECDITHTPQIESAFKKIRKDIGPISILINNAAEFGINHKIVDLPERVWLDVLDTNLNGTFAITKEALKDMVHQNFGHVLTIGSVAGEFNYQERSPYSVSKAALVQFTNNVAAEYAKHNVVANTIVIGHVEGDRLDNVIKNSADASPDRSINSVRKKFMDQYKIGRILTAEDVANQILFELTSPLGRLKSGRKIYLDCGFKL